MFGYLHTLPDIVGFFLCIYSVGSESLSVMLLSCAGATLISRQGF